MYELCSCINSVNYHLNQIPPKFKSLGSDYGQYRRRLTELAIDKLGVSSKRARWKLKPPLGQTWYTRYGPRRSEPNTKIIKRAEEETNRVKLSN